MAAKARTAICNVNKEKSHYFPYPFGFLIRVWIFFSLLLPLPFPNTYNDGFVHFGAISCERNQTICFPSIQHIFLYEFSNDSPRPIRCLCYVTPFCAAYFFFANHFCTEFQLHCTNMSISRLRSWNKNTSPRPFPPLCESVAAAVAKNKSFTSFWNERKKKQPSFVTQRHSIHEKTATTTTTTTTKINIKLLSIEKSRSVIIIFHNINHFLFSFV